MRPLPKKLVVTRDMMGKETYTCMKERFQWWDQYYVGKFNIQYKRHKFRKSGGQRKCLI